MRTTLCLLVLFDLMSADTLDGPLIRTGYHVTARPWQPLVVSRNEYLKTIEGVCRFSIQHQNEKGAIIDPILKREHQYATPYFANAVSTLIAAGHATDLLKHGAKAMDHATECFAGGQAAIPDQHGNFFIAALTEALENFRGHVPSAQWNVWRERMKKPRADVVSDGTNNWETYVMKGEWMRVKQGLAGRDDATAAIENSWKLRQRARVANPPWRLYHDRTSEPDTLSVEAVGRGNLLALAHLGYDGPSAAEIREWAEAGTALTMWLQDPSGQVPANGRTDNHVWVEVGYQLGFEVMAERMKERDSWLAGQFRRAAMLSFNSIKRWQRRDDPWTGSFFVTKNRFDPSLRVGYQRASEYSNYNGSLMFHLAEAYHARKSEIAERPTPSEIGGYAIALDDQYASVFANAGGMQIQVNLRGQVAESHANRWTPLGVVRFARPLWDTRIGPSDGALTEAGGVSFGPTFYENGRWLRLADLSSRYEGRWDVEFVHPLLVRCSVTWWPKSLQSGPIFRQHFTITPDGVLSVVTKASPASVQWGVTWPLLENDGTPLVRSGGPGWLSTGYPDSADRQNFIALGGAADMIEETPLRGSYGDLRPVRVVVKGDQNRTFVYPSAAGDPDAESVRKSFVLTADGFQSVLGRVSGTMYVGRTSAGGLGDRVDLDGDGSPEVTFDKPCGFVLQLDNGVVTAIESDREAIARIGGRRIELKRYSPVVVTAKSSASGRTN